MQQHVERAGPSRADEQIEVVADEAGFGKHAVRQGDLVLMHYTGKQTSFCHRSYSHQSGMVTTLLGPCCCPTTTVMVIMPFPAQINLIRRLRMSPCPCLHHAGTLEDGQVFDSTKGGLKYRDGGDGVFRPVVVRLSGYPQPGICLGLQQAVEGMKIGGKRTVKVPAGLGFGDKTVLAPYAIVPGNATVQYEIELLRVSSVGPDLLVKVRELDSGMRWQLQQWAVWWPAHGAGSKACAGANSWAACVPAS